MSKDLVVTIGEAVSRLRESQVPVTGPSGDGEVPPIGWDDLRELVQLVDGEPTEPGGSRGTRATLLVAAELARNNLSTPWVPAMCVGRPLRELADAGEPGSDLVVPAAVDEQEVELRRAGGRWYLTGTIAIPWGDFAVDIALTVDHPTGLQVPVVEALSPGVVPVQAWTNAAGEPWGRMTFTDVECRAVGTSRDLTREAVRGRWALGVAAQLLGAMRQVQELCAQRSPGRAGALWVRGIGSVPRHPLVDIASQVTLSGAAVNAAARAVEEQGWSEAALSLAAVAKTQSGQAAQAVATLAHQLHGTDGATLGHPLGQSTRRLLAWRDEGGDGGVWSQWLGDRAGRCPTGTGLLEAFDATAPARPALHEDA